METMKCPNCGTTLIKQSLGVGYVGESLEKDDVVVRFATRPHIVRKQSKLVSMLRQECLTLLWDRVPSRVM